MLNALIHGTWIVYYRYEVARPIISGYTDYERSGAMFSIKTVSEIVY